MVPPKELIDPEGEGIYLLAQEPYGLLMRAAWLFYGDRREWKMVETQVFYMYPSEDGETWVPWYARRWLPRYWRLNLPRKWRPVPYLYCTPRAD